MECAVQIRGDSKVLHLCCKMCGRHVAKWQIATPSFSLLKNENKKSHRSQKAALWIQSVLSLTDFKEV